MYYTCVGLRNLKVEVKRWVGSEGELIIYFQPDRLPIPLNSTVPWTRNIGGKHCNATFTFSKSHNWLSGRCPVLSTKSNVFGHNVVLHDPPSLLIIRTTCLVAPCIAESIQETFLYNHPFFHCPKSVQTTRRYIVILLHHRWNGRVKLCRHTQTHTWDTSSFCYTITEMDGWNSADTHMLLYETWRVILIYTQQEEQSSGLFSWMRASLKVARKQHCCIWCSWRKVCQETVPNEQITNSLDNSYGWTPVQKGWAWEVATCTTGNGTTGNGPTGSVHIVNANG